jgi:pyruvate kinase
VRQEILRGAFVAGAQGLTTAGRLTMALTVQPSASKARSARRHATIVCTLGPACSAPETTRAMVDAGMDVARLNFSHGDHRQKRRLVRLVRRVGRESGKTLAILQDLQGPKLRVGDLAGGGITLTPGGEVTITTQPCMGTAERFSVTYPQLTDDVRPGQEILLADGRITLRVRAVAGTEVQCEVVHGGRLTPRKGINLPGVALSIGSLTQKDRADVAFGVQHGVDWIALSFVRRAVDIVELRELIASLRDRGVHPRDSLPPRIIAKIEKPEALGDYEAILEQTDAIMVARGDLGVEIKPERVPIVQKEMIYAALERGIPVITATQMLQSMTRAPLPTRAEVSDVANAILDGSDAVMLSDETAAGDFPVQSVRMLDRIVREVESSALYHPPRCASTDDPCDAVAASACELAMSANAAAIAVFTHTGATAIHIARFRPRMPIVALCHTPAVCRQLMVYWNIMPMKVPLCRTLPRMGRVADASVRRAGITDGDSLYVVVAGSSRQPGQTDSLQLRRLDAAMEEEL